MNLSFSSELKLFLKIASKNPDVVSEYIAIGKPLEIVEIIKTHENSGMETISLLYQALKLLISSLIEEKNETKTKLAIDALKNLIRKSKTTVNKMLLSASLNDKVTAFEILSIGVSIDREIGIEILKNVDLFSKPDEKKTLSSLLFGDAKVTPKDFKTVRKSFSTMMMEFMMRTEEDIILCKRVVQKRVLFEFFLEGVHRDSSETIVDILACLTKRILLSHAFSKPEKLKVFTDEAIKSLLKLYEWKGSDDQERNTVVSMAHQFLILLLANKKYGIVFKALSEKRQNFRQLNVIGLFKNVWMLEHPSLLVIEIIKSCPELMQNILNRLAVGLQPKVTTQWFMCANFTKLLIQSLEPSEMIKQFATLESKKISNNIIKLSISQFILQNLTENALLQLESLEIRETSVQILHLMLERCCQYINLVASLTNLKDFEKHRIKFDIINHIFTFYPHIDMILNSLYRSISLSKKQRSENNDATIELQLKNTLAILLLTAEYFPSVVEKIPSVIDFLEVLRPIYENESNMKNKSDIEMNVTKVILYLQPSLLSLKPELFQRVFFMLIQIIAHDNDIKRKGEAKNLLMNILQHKYSFFEKNPFEAIIWIESFRYLSGDVIKEAASLLVKAFEKTGNENELGMSAVLSNLLSANGNKLNRVIDFIETAVVLLYHTFPENRKNILSLLKEADLSTDEKIILYLKKKCDFDEIAGKSALKPYARLKKSIKTKLHLNNLKITDENQLLLLHIHIILFALNEKDLNDKCIENLINLAKEVYAKMEPFDNLNSINNETVEMEEESEAPVVNKILRLRNIKLTELTTKYIFELNTTLLEKFSLHGDDSHQITKLTANLAEIFKSTKDFNQVCRQYRAKIVAELEQNSDLQDVESLNVLGKFPLDENQCCEVFDSCSKTEKVNANLINFILKRIIELNAKPLDAQQIKRLEVKYLSAVQCEDSSLSTLEGTTLEYLRTFPHNISDLSTQIFAKGCEEDALITRRSFVNLLTTIFKSKRDCDAIFLSKFKNMRKEVVYPLLYVALEQNVLPQAECRSLFQKEFKAGILKSIERPKRAAIMYRDYLNTSLKLIQIVMSPNECCDIALKKFKFDGSELYQLRLLEAVFIKAIRYKNDAGELEDVKTIFDNFVNHWITLMSATSDENLKYFDVITSWLTLKLTSNHQVEVNLDNLRNAYKIGLRRGLKDDSKLLISLGLLLESADIETNTIDEMFDMLITHSNFFATAFNTKSSGIKWKTSLFYLFDVLVRKNPKLANEKHIPILLSSYNASISSCDQLILNLLRFYEFECSIDLYDFRPLIFGAAGLSYYSINRKENASEKNTIDGKNSAFHKLVNQFEKSVIENTINNFPIKPMEKFNVELFLKNSKYEEEDSKIYDPAYFLPLFEMLLTTDSFDFTSAGIKYNLMPLIVSGLSCEDERMRLMAARILLNCRAITAGKK